MTSLLVTGATGTVGSSVVRELRSRGIAVRAFVRDPDRARTLVGSDVDLAAGDFADRESLAVALNGVERVFLACANHPRQFEYEANVIDAAKAAGVELIVKLSAVGAAVGSPLEFWHAQGRIEQHLADSGVPAVVLRPTMYMTGLLAAAETISQMGKLFVPAEQAAVAMVDPRDVADAAAAALASQAANETWTLTGPESLTYAQIADELSVVVGRAVDYVDIPDEQAQAALLQAGMPEWLAANLLTLFGLVRQGALSRTTGTVRAVTGHEPRRFSQFASDFGHVFNAHH